MAETAAILAIADPQLRRDEGESLTAYLDTRGNWTIGIGRCDPGVTQGMTCTQAQADQWLNARLVQICAAFDAGIPWWRGLDAPRAAVLVNIGYNVGAHGFMGWRHTLGYVQAGNYAMASAELLMTEPWADEVGDRATRLAAQMRTGVAQ
ncbi:MAG: glycoside hydrolase family protein [Caulobacteraceae bacterium]